MSSILLFVTTLPLAVAKFVSIIGGYDLFWWLK